ncbi:MAG: hypothetical protein WC521_06520 [Bdellovibrionales bacterium]
MADAKAKKQPAGKPKKGGGKFKFILGAIMIAVAMPFMLASVMLLIAGLVPTYVAYATDDDPDKTGATCVCAMNLAGIFPFLMDLWIKGQTPNNALLILSDANSWLVILGASAIGQLIIYAVPQAIATMSLTHAEGRIKTLRKNLDFLKDAWGPEVGTTKPVEQIAED